MMKSLRTPPILRLVARQPSDFKVWGYINWFSIIKSSGGLVASYVLPNLRQGREIDILKGRYKHVPMTVMKEKTPTTLELSVRALLVRAFLQDAQARSRGGLSERSDGLRLRFRPSKTNVDCGKLQKSSHADQVTRHVVAPFRGNECQRQRERQLTRAQYAQFMHLAKDEVED